MIVLRYNEDIKHDIMRVVEQALKGYEAEIVEVDEEATELEILSSVAFNTRKSRVYIGRLERNTNNINTQLRALTDALTPVATLASTILEEIEEGKIAEEEKAIEEDDTTPYWDRSDI